MRYFRASAIVGAVILIPLYSLVAQENLPMLLEKLRVKDSLTLLITDSGLGGLSVAAGIEQKAREENSFAHLRLVFFNAQPAVGVGYNKMKSREQKVRVFDDVLKGMCDRYSPDAIFIACNTLSVVYPFTRFSRTSSIPVIGIVGMGVDMIAEALAKDATATALIFGTETTIAADAHREGLLKKGIAPDRIVTQACPGLGGQIEEGATSKRVRENIGGFVREAIGHAGTGRKTIVAGLCCTHYGYSEGVFRSQLAREGATTIVMVNPNIRMSSALFSPDRKNTHPSGETTVEVVSRMPISQQEQTTIGALVRPMSKRTAAALKKYHHDPDLFHFQLSAD